MKRILFLSAACLLTLSASAQQLPWLVFYRQNWQLLNPAALSRYFYEIKGKTPEPPDRISFGFRSEGIKTKEAPITGFANFEILYPERRIRWGGQFFFDKTDAISYLGGAINFSYILLDDSKLKVSMGIQPSFFRYQVNLNKLRPEVANDPLLNHYEHPRYNLDCGFGFFIKKLAGVKNKGHGNIVKRPEWYLGLSSPNLVLLTKRRNGNIGMGSERAAHLNIIAGRFQDLKGENASLETTIWIRAAQNSHFLNIFGDRSILSIDGNVRLHINGQSEKGFWLGAGFGTNRVGSVEFGYADRKKYKYQLMLSVSGPLSNRTYRLGTGGIGMETTLTLPFSPPDWARTYRKQAG